MQLALYWTRQRLCPLVLVAECMQPSLEMQQRFGVLYFKGIVELDEAMLRAATDPHVCESASQGFEYAVTCT